MITIYNYLKAGNNIYSSNVLTYDYMDSDIVSALELTLKNKYGSLCLFTDDETEIKNTVDAMFMLNAHRYNALYNIDTVNDPSIEFYEKETNTGTQTITNTGTVTTTNTGTETTTNTGTVTNELTPSTIETVTQNKNTADNATLRVTGSTVTSSTGSDVNERTDNTTNERTDDLTNERTDDTTAERTDDLTREREGYNNLIENAERITRLMNNAIFDIIIKDTLDSITYNIYGYEDLKL